MAKVSRLRVLMAPDYRARNPYQSLLADGLAKLGARVWFPHGYRRVLPFRRALADQPEPVEVLHLHWLAPYLKGEGSLTYLIYAIKLVIDLYLVRAAGARVVWTVHNRLSHESRHRSIEGWVRNRVAGLSGAIIVHTQSALDAVRQDLHVPPSRFRVIPHGHYRTVYSPLTGAAGARQALGLKPEGRVFLHFGMMRPYKGIERLLAAWNQVYPSQPETTLLLAGEFLNKNYEDEIRRLVEGCSGVVLRAERVPDASVHLYFSAADVVVLPFERSLTSGTVLLAMSFGKAIIAPRLPSVLEVVGTACDLLYDEHQEAGLEGALRLAASIDAEALGSRVAALCDALDWDSIARQTVLAYTA